MGAVVTDIGLGVKVIEFDYFEDFRGYYSESYSKRTFKNLKIDIDFVQDSHSYSIKKGTIRGIHFQKAPYAQTKLVRCTNGRVLDFAVDLRKDSSTYKQWVSVELSKENRKQVLIPRGFGHAFITLTDDCEVLYKVDNLYYPKEDRAIKFDDPEIGIEWGTKSPIISEKDKHAPLLSESDNNMMVGNLL